MNRYPKLPETQRSLKSAWVSSPRQFGSHYNSRLELVKTGRMTTEIPYDPVKHQRLAPNPLSVQKILTGQDHVPYRQPRKPMDIDVVVHADPNDRNDLKWVTQAKDKTMLNLAGALSLARSGFGDRVFTHIVGDVERLDGEVVGNAYVLHETDDENEAVSKVLDICYNGLTYIISSFKHLPLHTSRKCIGGNVGVKVNHLFETEMQPNTGIFVTGEPENPYIDTSDEVQRTGWNEVLKTRNNAVITRLGNSGLAIAQVTFEGRSVDPKWGFDVAAADRAMADATLVAVGLK